MQFICVNLSCNVNCNVKIFPHSMNQLIVTFLSQLINTVLITDVIYRY